LKGYALPPEMKKALIDRGKSLTQWCREKGFNKALVQLVINNPHRDFSNAPKQKQILKALKKDFPEFFEKDTKRLQK